MAIPVNTALYISFSLIFYSNLRYKYEPNKIHDIAKNQGYPIKSTIAPKANNGKAKNISAVVPVNSDIIKTMNIVIQNILSLPRIYN